MKNMGWKISAIAAILLAASAGIAHAQEQVLYSFQGGTTDGKAPNGGLAIDKAGNLYGVGSSGGANSGGVIYELSPPSQSGGAWTETIVYNFGDDPGAGGSPGGVGAGATVIFDSNGNLYGTAGGGDTAGMGEDNAGVVYEASPPAGGGEWTAQALYTFIYNPSDQTLLDNPNGAVVFDKSGNLYGIATGGGTYGGGGVFELSPPAQSGGAWTMQPLYSFNNSIVASLPWGPGANASLILDAAGNLYGTTEYGGVSDLGTVYELSPPAPGGNGEWTPTILYSFHATKAAEFDGTLPFGSLIFDKLGNLYGSTTSGGTGEGGIVFELSPPASSGGKWTETVLYNFTYATATDVSTPNANLLFDKQGNLWGTGFHGGPYSYQYVTDGAIFELIPQSGGTWTEASPMPHYFGAESGDAFDPESPIIMDSDGNIYSTGTGGANMCNSVAYCGAVWEYTPPAPAATPAFNPPAGTYTTAQSVEISDSIPGAKIYYTTNGTMPTTSSTEYSTAIKVAASETLSAIALATGYAQSSVATAAYVIETPAATPVISPASGTYPAAFLVKITDATPGASIYFTTNGTTPTTTSKKYTAEFKVTDNQTIRAIASANDYTPSKVASAVYAVRTATPVFSVKAGKYPKAQSVKIADTTPGAAIYYTVNGTTPTSASKKYTGVITVSENETIKSIALAKGYAESEVADAPYTIETAPPTISPDGGTFTKAQTVTLKDATVGAIIYYTTNDATPTAKSSKYTKAFTVNANETVKAVAIAGGHAESGVTTAKFTIN
jgi:uncharacterized repeat protein (TIGR03803 family)